jgi:hypothetical protein
MFAIVVHFQELSYDLGLSGASGASAFLEFIRHIPSRFTSQVISDDTATV